MLSNIMYHLRIGFMACILSLFGVMYRLGAGCGALYLRSVGCDVMYHAKVVYGGMCHHSSSCVMYQDWT